MNVNDPSWKYGMFILFLLFLGPIGVLAWFFIDVLGQRLSRSWMVGSVLLVLFLNIVGLVVYYIFIRNRELRMA